MNGRDYLNEVMAFTPEMVNKPNYNMNQDKFNALAKLYSNITFVTAAIGYYEKTDKAKEVCKQFCEELVNDENRYSYDSLRARIMNKIVAKYGVASCREKIAQYNKIVIKTMKEQFAIYYELVKAYGENRGDEDVQAVVDGNPGKELYLLYLQIEQLKKENAKRDERIKKLEAEEAELKAEEAELKAKKEDLERRSPLLMEGSEPKQKNSILDNLLNFFQHH